MFLFNFNIHTLSIVILYIYLLHTLSSQVSAYQLQILICWVLCFQNETDCGESNSKNPGRDYSHREVPFGNNYRTTWSFEKIL